MLTLGATKLAKSQLCDSLRKKIGFSATMKVVCGSCKIVKQRLYDSIRYNKKMLHVLVTKYVGDKKNTKNAKQSITKNESIMIPFKLSTKMNVFIIHPTKKLKAVPITPREIH